MAELHSTQKEKIEDPYQTFSEIDPILADVLKINTPYTLTQLRAIRLTKLLASHTDTKPSEDKKTYDVDGINYAFKLLINNFTPDQPKTDNSEPDHYSSTNNQRQRAPETNIESSIAVEEKLLGDIYHSITEALNLIDSIDFDYKKSGQWSIESDGSVRTNSAGSPFQPITFIIEGKKVVLSLDNIIGANGRINQSAVKEFQSNLALAKSSGELQRIRDKKNKTADLLNDHSNAMHHLAERSKALVQNLDKLKDDYSSLKLQLQVINAISSNLQQEFSKLLSETQAPGLRHIITKRVDLFAVGNSARDIKQSFTDLIGQLQSQLIKDFPLVIQFTGEMGKENLSSNSRFSMLNIINKTYQDELTNKHNELNILEGRGNKLTEPARQKIAELKLDLGEEPRIGKRESLRVKISGNYSPELTSALKIYNDKRSQIDNLLERLKEVQNSQSRDRQAGFSSTDISTLKTSLNKVREQVHSLSDKVDALEKLLR